MTKSTKSGLRWRMAWLEIPTKAHSQVHQLSEVLNRTLIELEVLPARAFKSVSDDRSQSGQFYVFKR